MDHDQVKVQVPVQAGKEWGAFSEVLGTTTLFFGEIASAITGVRILFLVVGEPLPELPQRGVVLGDDRTELSSEFLVGAILGSSRWSISYPIQPFERPR
jgi:hypothetical protein